MKNVQRKLLKIQIISTHIYIYMKHSGDERGSEKDRSTS